MLIGVLFSAVMGGLAGMAWSLTQQHELPGVMAAYPTGGILAVMGFVMLAFLRGDPSQRQNMVRD